jgi:hypothetical protein
MNVHLLLSEEYPEKDFHDLLRFLTKSPGPVSFIPSDDDIKWEEDELHDLDWEDEALMKKKAFPDVKFRMNLLSESSRSYLEWPDVFQKCKDYRNKNQIPDDESIIILTSHANEYNWFSAGDPAGGKDFFIHTDLWDTYVDGKPKFAIGYEVAVLVLQSLLFDTYSELASYAHTNSTGCINDLCENKSDIGIKFRTADLCEECMTLLETRKIDPNIMVQVYSILDRVRHQFLFRERFKVTRQPSRLEIREWNHRIFLPDLDDEEIRLSPLQRAVYLLFLKHPEGIAFHDVSDYQDELEKLYSYTYTGGAVATMKKAVETIVINEDGKLSEVISKIKRKIITQLGAEMAENYIIQGDKGEKRRTLLDRKLIKF